MEVKPVEDKVLKALGDPKRFLLLRLMAERGYCVQALARASRMTESAVSQHLKVLREAGLAYGVKIGYYTHYRVNEEALKQVIDELNALLSLKRQPCGGPFYGCPEAEFVRCKSYVPPEQRGKETKETC